MSPLELPGKSFGNLPDPRNIECDNCGRSFRKFMLADGEKDLRKGVIKLRCPYCSYPLEILDISLETETEEEWEEGWKNEQEEEWEDEEEERS